MVIQFPSDLTSRTEKIKQIQQKARPNSKVNQMNQINLNPKPTTKFTINVANISELSKNIEQMEDTLKYVTDCIYDFSVTLEKFRKNILVMFFVALVSMFVWKLL